MALTSDYDLRDPSASTDAAGSKHASALLAQVALSQATQLARVGHYAEAEKALDVAPGTPTPPVLDLLARIRAQQGRLTDARTLWTEAARLDPNNESYSAALHRLARIGRYRWTKAGQLLAGVMLAVILVAVFAKVMKAWRRHERAVILNEFRPTLPVPKAPAVLEISFEIPGVTRRVEGAEVVLRFDSGLFKKGDILTPEAKVLLNAVGSRLKPMASKVTVCIVGYTNNLPVKHTVHFRDNQFLALARAHAAAGFIASSAGIPSRQLTLQPAEGFIYPNDTPGNRAKNRSIEIRISAKQN